MKRTALILLVAAFGFFGCNKDKIKALETQNQQLTEEAMMKDSLLGEFMTSFNEFEDNLEMIRQRENLVSTNAADPEMRRNGKEKIMEDVQMINGLLEENRRIIAELEKKNSSSASKSRSLQTMIANMTKQVEEKDVEIATMKEQLANLNFEVTSLNTTVADLSTARQQLDSVRQVQAAEIANQTQTIQEQTQSLNTKYYVVGTAKELEAQHVLVKTGGVAGIGRTATLEKDFDKTAFTAIDQTQFNRISLSGKKVQVVTAHPSSSYSLETEDKVVDALLINDAKSFWRSSKYLVVVVD